MKACLAATLLVCACGPIAPEGGGGAKPPAPAPAWRPATLDDLRGHWSGVDRDAWLYKLAIDGDAFTLAIDRAEKGACAEKGKLAIGAHDDDRGFTALAMTYEQDTCNPSYAGATVTAHVPDGDRLTIAWPDAIVRFGDDDEVIELRGKR
jgi:hypothetical protein